MNPVGVMQGGRIQVFAEDVEEQPGKADQAAQRRPDVVRRRITEGLELGRGRTESGAPYSQPPLRVAGLGEDLRPKPGMLDGNGERASQLEGDIPVLGLKRSASGRS